jgi:hypothetical protein
MTEDDLTPTQQLIIEVLVARARLGHRGWNFPSSLRPQIKKMEEGGLVGWKNWVVENTLLVWLTDEGRKQTMASNYTYPPKPPEDPR